MLGIPSIGVIGAFGLSLLVRSLVGDVSKKSESEGIGKVIGTALIRPAALIAFGWVAHFFI